MAGGSGGGGKRARDAKERRLTETLDEVVGAPPYANGFDPISIAHTALDRIPSHSALTPAQARKLRKAFDSHVESLREFRARIDNVADPETSFDPGNPDTVGRLVMIALMAQDRVPLSEIRPTYGSGVYAIYYNGAHPAYAEISATETPIYVGKADPDMPQAATPRQQGVRLFTRLTDHRDAIREVEGFALASNMPYPLRLADFDCRRLVCATNAQLVAERHLIDVFKPAWNSETKICFGISKHGDNAQTRRNKKSPWDVLHPGRAWATESEVRAGMSQDSIAQKLSAHFVSSIPFRDPDDIMSLMLDSFRQIGSAPPELSEAAAHDEDVEISREHDGADDQAALDLE